MLQTVAGIELYVVDLNTLPELPITWNSPEEEPYARALQMAIQDGHISEPGKYGIRVYLFESTVEVEYEVAKITE